MPNQVYESTYPRQVTYFKRQVESLVSWLSSSILDIFYCWS